MRYLVFVGCVLFLFSSCVSKEDYQKLKEDNNQLQQQLQIMKDQLEEEKYGAAKLLKEANDFLDANDVDQAESKLKTLLEKHPDKSEAVSAKSLLVAVDAKKKVIAEDNLWKNANESDDMSYVKQYIDQYPLGRYIERARIREVRLKSQMQNAAFQNAVSTNSSVVWKQFLEDYPDYKDKEYVRKKIIQAEVDEIMRGEHGQLPSFTSSYSSDGYSESSSVAITNGTGYTLTIRYSGPDVKMIEIPAGETTSVYLSSGNYTIAASVNAANVRNYAGTEFLSGKYNSRFYISSSYY